MESIFHAIELYIFHWIHLQILYVSLKIYMISQNCLVSKETQSDSPVGESKQEGVYMFIHMNKNTYVL